MSDQEGKVETGQGSAGERRAKPERPRLRIGAILAGVLLLVVVGWLVFHDGSSDDGSGEVSSSGEPALERVADESEFPVYWAGPQEGAEPEVTTAEEGSRVYVRYLTGGAKPGDPRADFLTVGTYAYEDAVAALRKQGSKPGGVLKAAPGGATVYFSRARPQSVYVGYPGVEVEVEVYDPDPQKALELATSGQIVAAG